MPLSPGTRLGPYEIEAPIGKGGMGEVYRARDSRLDRTVAIKVLPPAVVDHPSRLQRFQREARAASRLSHPHICALYDVGEQDGVHFIVMEHLEGETLADRLKSGALQVGEALRHAAEVADALDHAHRHGIVHRDLKPSNIMLTRSGTKLLDFGVARFQISDETHSLAAQPTESLTEAGTVLGTLHYMSPEQLEGREADARTDVFALGAVIYEMVTGRQPFAGTTTASVIAAILEREPVPLMAARSQMRGEKSTDAITPLLEHVVARCLAKTPDERWQTAADLRQELKWVAQGNPPPGSRDPSTTSPGRQRARLTWMAVALGLAIAAIVYMLPRIDRSNGTAATPTYKQLTFRRGHLTQARFAPDGQTIFYSAGWDGGPVQTYETRANESGSGPIGPPSASIESVSTSNELALILGCKLDGGYCTGTLAKMPVSGGSPREVLEDVVGADWAPGGKELAVIHVTTLGESRLEFPVGTPLYTSAGKLQWIAFSPKGDRLAFVEHHVIDEEAGDLKVIDLQGRVATVVAKWRTLRGLKWSSDNEIWFTGARTGKTCSLYATALSGEPRVVLQAPGDVTLYDISRDGRLLITNGEGRAQMIWANAGQQRNLSWLDWSTVADVSNDGRTLLFFEWGAGVGGNPMVYTRATSGSDAVRLGDGKALALSPDGKWALALLEGTRPQLTLLPTRTGQSRPLPMSDVTDVYWARWFPDSRQLLVAASGADTVTRSYVQDIDTGQTKRVAEDGAIAVLVSPDSQSILALDPLGGYYLWPIAGGAPVRLEGLLPEERVLQWSRDGFLYLYDDEQQVLRIHRYALATRRREVWRELKPGDLTGVVGIAAGRGEVAITPDGKGVAFSYWMLIEDLFLVEGVARAGR